MHGVLLHVKVLIVGFLVFSIGAGLDSVSVELVSMTTFRSGGDSGIGAPADIGVPTSAGVMGVPTLLFGVEFFVGEVCI